MAFFLGLITAHFVSDFVLQSGFKEQRKGVFMLRHFLVVAAMAALVLYGFTQWRVVEQLSLLMLVLIALAVGLLHLTQDVIVSVLFRKLKRRSPDLLSLATDQGLHLLVLLFVAGYLNRTHIVAVMTSSSGALDLEVILALQTILLVAITTGISAVLIASLLAPFQQRLAGSVADSPSAGLWIGICERFLLVLVIATGSDVFPAVGLVFTAKSIFRFRELENRANAEYYLLGSLLSISVAVVAGLTLRLLYPEAVLSRFH